MLAYRLILQIHGRCQGVCLTARNRSSNSGDGYKTMRNLHVKWGLSLANRGALFGLTDVDELIEAYGEDAVLVFP